MPDSWSLVLSISTRSTSLSCALINPTSRITPPVILELKIPLCGRMRRGEPKGLARIVVVFKPIAPTHSITWVLFAGHDRALPVDTALGEEATEGEDTFALDNALTMPSPTAAPSI